MAELLAASPRPLVPSGQESIFQARGGWRERLPVIPDTLAAPGRARPVAGAAGNETARGSAA